MVPRALLVNRANPELNYLAAALSRKGLLYKYVRPYTNKGRTWERWLRVILGDAYNSSFGRRVMPDGLELERVTEIAILDDFGMTMALSIGKWLPQLFPLAEKWSSRLNSAVFERLDSNASTLAASASCVVGNVLVALKSFQLTSGIKVLNSSNAHHRYINQWAQEEAILQPEFAFTLPWLELEQAEVSHMDQEYALADRILVGSSFAKDTHIRSGIPEEKVLIVPYGTDLSLFSNTEPITTDDQTFKIIFVGQIGQRKGISYLLRAYEKFQRQGTTLTLVGDFVKSHLPFESYRHLFTHISHIPRAKLVQILRTMDVFVFPTLMEGMGLVVLEAMACGLPVIVTSNGPGDIVRDGVDGFVVPPRDAEAIVERLDYLYEHPEDRKKMGMNARERAKLFSWENYAEAAMAAIFDGGQTHPGLARNPK